VESQSNEIVAQSMEKVRLNPPLFLRCLDLMGKRLIPAVIAAKMALCAMEILIRLNRKFNFLPDAIYLLSIAISEIESSFDSMALEHCIANEELLQEVKLHWCEFCARFLEYLCFARKIPFAVSVAIQVVNTITPLINSNTKCSIAALWRDVSGSQRVFESVEHLSKVSNLATLRKACITSELPVPLVKCYMTLADCYSE
jgi:hypothetical protein